MSLRSNTIESGTPRGAEIASAASPVDDASEVCRALGRVLCEGIDIHRCQAAQALGRIHDPAGVRPLVDALRDEDEDVRTDAAGALARLAPPAAGRQLLENLLGDPCTGVKLNAIDALTRLRHPELAPWLRRMAAGRDDEIAWDESEFYEGGWDDWVDIQVKAIQALAELGGEAAVAALAEVLGDDDRQLRLEVLAALAALAAAEEAWPNAAGETLLAALRGELVPAPEFEAEAPAAARGSGEPALAKRDEAVPEAAFPKSTMESILGGDVPPLAETEGAAPVEPTQADLDRLALAARNTGKKVVPVVPRVAPHQDVRRFAARVLGGLARDEVADALAQALGAQALGAQALGAQALGEDDAELRRVAADSLARFGDGIAAFSEEVTDALLQALICADRDVRLSAIRALGAAGGARAAKVLEAQLRDPDGFVRAEAVRALAELGAAGPEVEALLARLDDYLAGC